MRLLITTVRRFPADQRKEFLQSLVRLNAAKGFHRLSQALKPLASGEVDRVVLADAAGPEHSVETIYEVLPE